MGPRAGPQSFWRPKIDGTSDCGHVKPERRCGPDHRSCVAGIRNIGEDQRVRNRRHSCRFRAAHNGDRTPWRSCRSDVIEHPFARHYHRSSCGFGQTELVGIVFDSEDGHELHPCCSSLLDKGRSFHEDQPRETPLFCRVQPACALHDLVLG